MGEEKVEEGEKATFKVFCPHLVPHNCDKLKKEGANHQDFALSQSLPNLSPISHLLCGLSSALFLHVVGSPSQDREKTPMLIKEAAGIV